MTALGVGVSGVGATTPPDTAEEKLTLEQLDELERSFMETAAAAGVPIVAAACSVDGGQSTCYGRNDARIVLATGTWNPDAAPTWLLQDFVDAATVGATTTTTTLAPAEPQADLTLTPSQQAAVRSAESYLDVMGFSREGLIDQLSSEFGDQYPVEDATVAVDSLTVDWNAEAVESAQSYLDVMGFSCQGLIDQLSSEFGDQYTVEEATYAATQVGLC